MDSNNSALLPHMPRPFSNQRATPPNSRSATPDPSDEALEEAGKGKDEKGERSSRKNKQDSIPGSSERAPPPPPPREHGVHSSTYSTPIPLDVNEMAYSLTIDPGDVSTAAQMVASVEHLNLGDEHTEGHLSHTTIGNKSGEQNCEQFTSTSKIPVDELNTKRFRDTLFTSPQRPTSVAASSLHNRGQSPAEVQVEGYTVRVDEAPDSEAQREFIELWKRKQEENDTLEFMDAPDAAVLEEMRSALSIHVRRPAPGTPQGDNVMAQDRLEPDPQRITRSVTRVASPTVAPGRTDAGHRCGSWCAPPINPAGNVGESAVERAGTKTDIYATEHQPRQEPNDSNLPTNVNTPRFGTPDMHGTRFAGPRSDTSDSLPDTATPSDIVDGAEVDILETGPRSINESADVTPRPIQDYSVNITGDPTSGNPRVSQIHFEISVTIELGNTRNALALDVFRLERLQLLQDSNEEAAIPLRLMIGGSLG